MESEDNQPKTIDNVIDLSDVFLNRQEIEAKRQEYVDFILQKVEQHYDQHIKPQHKKYAKFNSAKVKLEEMGLEWIKRFIKINAQHIITDAFCKDKGEAEKQNKVFYEQSIESVFNIYLEQIKQGETPLINDIFYEEFTLPNHREDAVYIDEKKLGF